MEKDTNSVNMSILYFYAISTNALLGEKRKKNSVFAAHTLSTTTATTRTENLFPEIKPCRR